MLPRKPIEIFPEPIWGEVLDNLTFKERSRIKRVCSFFNNYPYSIQPLLPIYQNFFENVLRTFLVINESKITPPIEKEFCIFLKGFMIAKLNNKPFTNEHIQNYPGLKKSLASILITSPSDNIDNNIELIATQLLKQLDPKENCTTPYQIFSLANVINLVKQLPQKEGKPLLDALLPLTTSPVNYNNINAILHNAVARCFAILFGINIDDSKNNDTLKTGLIRIMLVTTGYAPVVINKKTAGFHIYFTFKTPEIAKKTLHILKEIRLKATLKERKNDFLVDLGLIEPAAVCYSRSLGKIKNESQNSCRPR